MHECTHTLTYILYCCRCSCLIAGHMHILPGVKEWIESCINNGKENVNLLCSDHCTRCCALQKNTHSFTPGRYCLCHCQRSRKIISEIWTSWNKFSATKTLIQIILWAAVKKLIFRYFSVFVHEKVFSNTKSILHDLIPDKLGLFFQLNLRPDWSNKVLPIDSWDFALQY